MATTLTAYKDAYATLDFATYQPMVLRWISARTLYGISNIMALRSPKTANMANLNLPDIEVNLPIFHRLAMIPKTSWEVPEQVRNSIPTDVGPSNAQLVDNSNKPFTSRAATSADLSGYPDAAKTGERFYLHPIRVILEEQNEGGHKSFWSKLFGPFASKKIRDGDPALGLREIVTAQNPVLGNLNEVFENFEGVRNDLFARLLNAVTQWISSPSDEQYLVDFIAAETSQIVYSYFGGTLPDVVIDPGSRDGYAGTFEQVLSPIGIAHFYRQLYFNIEEGVGPIEQAFTVAPKETLEVVYETVRRQIHEEQIEIGSETVSEEAVETKNLDEVSDKVSSMVQRDFSAAMSASTSGSIGVWGISASASADFGNSSQRSFETSSRRIKEVTKRASERITKTFNIRTRSVEELTTTNLTRRLIANDTNAPVSYGLRRVLRKVKVKVQALGPRLIWQTYINEPGRGLAQSKFVHFQDIDDMVPTDFLPPGVPAAPKGGVDTGTITARVSVGRVPIPGGTHEELNFVTLKILASPDRVITSATIESMTNFPVDDEKQPVPLNSIPPFGSSWDPATNTYSISFAISAGDSNRVSVNYSYVWEPSEEIMNVWKATRDKALDEMKAEEVQEEFERKKALITEESKIKPRPANDLRREERYEIMGRLIRELFMSENDPSGPTPVEIEIFRQFFDIDMMFVYVHSSWWKPRYHSTGFDRKKYPITAESEPAKMGSSLGWLMQLDGDTRRNEFLNSPWVRVCVPIKPNMEAQAMGWLNVNIEGGLGFSLSDGPLKGLLDEILSIRQQEQELGINGPDWALEEINEIDQDQDDGVLTPQDVYPIVDEFEVTVPTEGFVYDQLEIDGSTS